MVQVRNPSGFHETLTPGLQYPIERREGGGSPVAEYVVALQ